MLNTPTGQSVVTAGDVTAGFKAVFVTPKGVLSAWARDIPQEIWHVKAASCWLTDSTGLKEGCLGVIAAVTTDEGKPSDLMVGFQMSNRHINLRGPIDVDRGLSFYFRKGAIVADDILSWAIIYERDVS